MASFLAFLGVSLLVIVTPGPDTAITVRNALLGGRSGGIFTSLGVALGQAIWALATSIGVVALLVACEPLFLAVKYAGAAYLVCLGLQALYAALRLGRQPTIQRTTTNRPLSSRVALRQGLISDLSNPKMAVFFVSLLPQFASGGTSGFAQLLGLGLVFSAMTFFWLACYSLAVARAGAILRRPRIRRAIEAVTGAVLLALGIRTAIADR
jgi:threonine/homoserine/homoserine lactone efflux protein